MAITAVLVLDGAVDDDRLRSLVSRRLLEYDRFRQRVEEAPGGLGRPHWVEAQPRLDEHVLKATLPEPRGKAELEALVGREMSTPLDPSRPLWRIVHVDNYSGGSVIVARLHHCIADGL